MIGGPVKKPYVPPRLIQYRSDQLPTNTLASLPAELRKHLLIGATYTTLVDTDRNYVRVSDSFCKLLGYAEEELIGQKYDYVTASGTNDIPTVYGLFQKLGYMHGLWVLVHRTGTNILVRYEAWLRSDSYIESNMELVRHLG
jgi:PAS domain S-box-containing protein